ncbi:MAG: ABC transporter ATP-binding protein [Bacteroidales bacterium]|nr:ABC transporter ATP-binding protein [Candidatus Latescibacterota bacterium]
MNICIENISKKYKGGNWGLKDFSLEIGPGVTGLLGPNGAGKTTLMNILATVTRPTSGTVKWDGTDIAGSPGTIRGILGYLPQYFGIYPNLSAREFLRYIAAIKGVPGKSSKRRIDDLLRLVNITDVADRPLAGLSGGMRQRVGIAQALLNDPKLLIVDEPTVGLDPEERVRFRHLLSDLAGDRIVILSTHIVSDVEAAATSIALMHGGSLLHYGPPEEILAAVDGKVWSCTISSDELENTRRQYIVSGTLRRSDGIHIRVVADEPPTQEAVSVPPTMEDAYLYCISSAEKCVSAVEVR